MFTASHFRSRIILWVSFSRAWTWTCICSEFLLTKHWRSNLLFIVMIIDKKDINYVFCDFQKTFDASCTVKENICRHSFSFPEGVEQYVTLKGKLCSRDCLGQVEFIETERIYPSDSSSKSAASKHVPIDFWCMELIYSKFLRTGKWYLHTQIIFPCDINIMLNKCICMF